ncbi:hypothetical protein DRW03_15285 [Corallococcus sp. H22C18031201]|nr:hypothetical protein DRW03_15285 [Corallococcus sp. H22C18031201]
MYRYFFDPPKPEAQEPLQWLVKLTAPESFHVSMTQAHDLEDFQVAMMETVLRPEAGKRIFR